MGRGTTVGVDDDLAPGQAAVALWAADDEPSGRVDQEAHIAFDQLLGQHRLDDFLDDRLGQGAVIDVGGMLGREHDGIDRVRLAVDIAQGDLRLGVRAQPGQTAVTAQVGLALDQPVGVIDGRRHQHRCLVAGIAEHQALVARALVEVDAPTFVDALGDVLALLVIGHQHRAAFVIDAVIGVVVADALDGVASHLDVVDMSAGRDFAGQNDQPGVDQRFGGNPREFVLSEDRVQNRVRNLVGDLVGVTL